MTGRHSGLGWPGAIGDHVRDATAPPYIGEHRTPAQLDEARRQASGVTWTRDPRRCEDCGHLEDRCQCPHDCTYPEDIP